MKASKFLVLALLGGMLLGCSSHTSDPVGYCEAVEQAGDLVAEKAMEEMIYQVRQVPREYQVLQQLGVSTSQQAFDQAMQESTGIRYFEMRLRPRMGAQGAAQKGVGSQAAWQERDQYLSYNLGQHLRLVVGNDTLPCSLAHRVAAHDMTPFTSYWLGFEGPEVPTGTDVQLIYNDPFFNHGPLKFMLPGAALEALPTIQFSES